MLDVDTPDEKVLADAMNWHGQTPVVVRTGSGKFHALYRFNNERRAIRPWDDKPTDLLGAGLAIAPPSRVAKGQYQIIQGRLDDLIASRSCASLKTGSILVRPAVRDRKNRVRVAITIYGAGPCGKLTTSTITSSF